MIPKPRYLRQEVIARRQKSWAGLSAEEVERVLANYDLGKWSLSRALGGTSSHNLLLLTERGKKVLKRYAWSIPSTQQEHSILIHLTRADFPAPRLVWNNQGESITELEDDHYAIYDFATGFNSAHFLLLPQHRRRLVAIAGETLANLHVATEGFSPKGKKLNGFKPDGSALWRDVSWHLNVLTQFESLLKSRRPAHEYDGFVTSLLDTLADDLVQVGRYYEDPAFEMPKRIIHGDYAPHNVLFGGPQLTTVLDFGDSCSDLRALDVARGVTSFARTRRGGLSTDLASVFLGAYRNIVRLQEEEVLAIPELVRWRYMKNIVLRLFHSLSASDRRISQSNIAVLRDRWSRIDWMKLNGDEFARELV